MNAVQFASFVTLFVTIFFASNVYAEVETDTETITLIKRSQADCLSCHRTNVKIVGPSWKDIAARYKGDANAQATLVEKVINGGRGKWDNLTNGLPMTSHLSKPTREQIEKIVTSILKI